MCCDPGDNKENNKIKSKWLLGFVRAKKCQYPRDPDLTKNNIYK